MDDPNFYSGYGFATDQLDFSKYDKLTDLEEAMYNEVLDIDLIDDLYYSLDDSLDDSSDPVETSSILDGHYSQYADDAIFFYIPDQTIVSDKPVKTYTTSEADQLIIKHVKKVFKLVYDNLKDDNNLPKALNNLSKTQAYQTINNLVDKMHLEKLTDNDWYIQYY